MYTRPTFQIGKAEMLAFLRERAFGSLVVTNDGTPFAVHVPFLADASADGALRVECHVARANPIHTFIGDGRKALLVCQGPDAYISPDWYGAANQVPTWTYVAVHLTGTAHILPEEQLLAHSDRLSAFFEEQLLPKKPWTSAKMDPGKLAAMRKAIVGIGMDVETIEGQKKLAQHKGEPEQRGAIAGLRARGRAADNEIAALMEQVREKTVSNT